MMRSRHAEQFQLMALVGPCLNSGRPSADQYRCRPSLAAIKALGSDRARRGPPVKPCAVDFMSTQSAIPLKYQFASLLARRALQPGWRALNALSLWGLGYNNWLSAVNGEDHFAHVWAKGFASNTPIVFDVGANEGDHTALILGILPSAQCHLFEPNPHTFTRLNKRFAECSNVTLNQKGVGARSQHAVLRDLEGDGTERASFVHETFDVIIRPDDHLTQEFEVEVVSLDEHATKLGIKRIDFLKIDTEGYERFVLEGCQALIADDRIDVIQLEMNEQNVIVDFSIFRLQKMLPRHEIYRLLPDGLEPVATRDVPYRAALDIPRYANIVAIPVDHAHQHLR